MSKRKTTSTPKNYPHAEYDLWTDDQSDVGYIHVNLVVTGYVAAVQVEIDHLRNQYLYLDLENVDKLLTLLTERRALLVKFAA